MKKVNILMAVATLILMQGCSFEELKNDLVKPGIEPYQVQIHGDISQQPATRVANDGFCAGDEVGVYLVNYSGETPGVLQLKGNQADNIRFYYDENGNWNSEYDIYYKDNETNVDFYGYYPYADPSSIEAYPFEVARDQSKGAENGQMATYEASDFLWANTKNVTPTASKVILSFQHKMASARVRFSKGSGWTDATEYEAVTKEVLVTSTIRKSTINLATGVVTPEGEAPLTGIVPMNDNGEFRAIVVPQKIPAGKTILTLTIAGLPRNYVKEHDIEYLPGKITTFDLSISKKENTGEYDVELKGISVTAWEADNVSHGEDAREYVVVHNAIPNRLEKTITERLEMDPSKIKNLKLTGTISLEDYFFIRENMISLQRINLKEVESIIDGEYAIPGRAFDGMKALTKCVFPDKLESIGKTVDGYVSTTWGATFAGTNLSGVLVLPEGLKYVSGFRGTMITDVKFPSTLEEIGDDAFASCSYLREEMVFPESLKRIGVSAFEGANITGSLNFPANLETIGEKAFKYCRRLRGSLVIPEKIKVISTEAFYETGLSGTLTLPDGLQEIASNAFAVTPLKGEVNIPEDVVVIGPGAFSGTLFNGSIVFPSNLMSLGAMAFAGCERLEGTIEFPESVLIIPSGVFSQCPNIEELKIHKHVEAIGDQAFYGCYGLMSIVSEAKIPPTVSSSTFAGVPKDNFTIEVPDASVARYKSSANWNEFKRIEAYKDFSISRSLYRTLNAEHSKEFNLRALVGATWSVESKPDWVQVSPMSGEGKAVVTVTTEELLKGSGNRSGEIIFLLDGQEYRSRMAVEQYDYQYGDGDVVQMQKATKGDGVDIIIAGDCFDAKDIAQGKYLAAIQEAYSHFFDIEPYLTYKDYFNVYGVFGMSADSGMGTVNTIRESRFGSQYTFASLVEADYPTIFAAACLAPINDNVKETLIILVENSYDYAGLSVVWGDGSSIAVVPMATDPAPYDFNGLIHRIAGGSCFGKLADENIYHNSFVNGCGYGCGDLSSSIRLMQSYGFYDNISLNGNWYDVLWSHLIFDPQYANVVDVYEGAFGHSRNVYRSESRSCMYNNMPYFNSISRESIVKRIKRYAGEEYSFEDFKANDNESFPTVATKSDWMWPDDNDYLGSFSQSAFKFMGEEPIFDKSLF